MIRPSLPLLLLAMFLPTLGAWVYFDLLDGSPAAGLAYLGSKIVQLSLPLYVFLQARRSRRFETRVAHHGRSLVAGLWSGLLILALTLGFAYLLRDWILTAGLRDQVEGKLQDFHLNTPKAYLLFALALSGLHSLYEEVYWRWLVFGGLKVGMRWPPAAILASLAFASHHVLVLRQFFGPEELWTHTVPGALAVAAGGALWAWLYQRHGSLLGPWVSHMLADIAIFAAGYSLFWG